MLITGCGGDKDVATDAKVEQKATAVVSPQAAVQKAETGSVDKTPWSGDAQGYIASGASQNLNMSYYYYG